MTGTSRSPAAPTFATLVPEFTEGALLEAFALHGARAILLVGSRVTGSDQPGSDVDFLAIFEDPTEIPAGVPLAGVVSMPHALGENWIGDLDGQEANVEAVPAATIERVAALARRPLDEGSAPILQPLEIRLLDRLRRYVPLRGGDYVRALGVDAALERLPMVAVVMRYCGVVSNLPTMRQLADQGDSVGLRLLLSIMAAALGHAAMSLHGNPETAWRKVVPGLRALERDGVTSPVTAGDLEAMLASADDRAALEALTGALARLRGAVEQRAREQPPWTEALRGLDAQG